jgi:hypothetical protein
MPLRLLLLLFFLMPALSFAQVPRLKPNAGTQLSQPKRQKQDKVKLVKPKTQQPNFKERPMAKPRFQPKSKEKASAQDRRINKRNQEKNRLIQQSEPKPRVEKSKQDHHRLIHEPKPQQAQKEDFKPNHKPNQVRVLPQNPPRPQYQPQNQRPRPQQNRPNHPSRKPMGSASQRKQVANVISRQQCRPEWAKFLYVGKTITIQDDVNAPIEGFSFGLGYRFKYLSLNLEGQIGGLSMSAIEAVRAHGSINLPIARCFTLSPFGGSSFVGKNVFDIMGNQTWDAGLILEYHFFPFLGVSTRYMANIWATQEEQKTLHSLLITLSLYF